jgi:hypothetical protein
VANGAAFRETLNVKGDAPHYIVSPQLATTAGYTKVAIRKLKEIHTATHPARLNRTPGQRNEGKGKAPLDEATEVQ